MFPDLKTAVASRILGRDLSHYSVVVEGETVKFRSGSIGSGEEEVDEVIVFKNGETYADYRYTRQSIPEPSEISVGMETHVKMQTPKCLAQLVNRLFR